MSKIIKNIPVIIVRKKKKQLSVDMLKVLETMDKRVELMQMIIR